MFKIYLQTYSCLVVEYVFLSYKKMNKTSIYFTQLIDIKRLNSSKLAERQESDVVKILILFKFIVRVRVKHNRRFVNAKKGTENTTHAYICTCVHAEFITLLPYVIYTVAYLQGGEVQGYETLPEPQ